ncbi:hypothetical protein BC829DRAFT_271904 [Chytridium lagenaria]|nr:hypothetical protein BC829DRAFT_271904 [Chytridium lagenaria]
MESQSLEIHNINSELRQRSEAYREELAKIVKLHNTSITQLQADLDIRERQVDELQTALERQRLEFGDIKDELKRRIDHEQKLQNALTSRDIQFQEQLEEVKRKKERESNALISSLISEKEKLDAELKLIRHQNESLQAQYPNLNIIQEEHEGNVAELHNTVEFLQKENEDLVRTIRAMREDMETIQKSVQDGNGVFSGSLVRPAIKEKLEMTMPFQISTITKH